MKDADIKVVGLSSGNPKVKTNWKVLGAIIGVIVLAVGVIAGIILVKQQQNVSEQAAGNCNERCPGTDGNLYNCHPPEGNGNPTVSLCNANFKGRIEFCGTRNYCCTGTTWTANMSTCATPTSSPTTKPTSSPTARSSPTVSSTATAKPTATATSTSGTKTATPTSTTKATATATPVPLPVTGVEWPTIVGGGFGIIMILVSVALAI